MQIKWAVVSDPGRHRSNNEDSYCAYPELGLFVVADGMGGHAGGEVASVLAAEEIKSVIQATASLGPQDTWPVPFDPTCGVGGNRLRAGFNLANRQIAKRVSEDDALRGMATTAVAVLLGEEAAALAHVGDSRAYLYQTGRLKRLTADHSWVEEQVRAGMLSEEAALEHPWRNIVTRALSGGPNLDVEITNLSLAPGDRLLLCSDGLSSVVPDCEIAQMVAEATSENLQSGCDALVERANAAGGPDNVTALIVEVVRFEGKVPV